jgi:O-antigen/teichoic acid export membrane protein
VEKVKKALLGVTTFNFLSAGLGFMTNIFLARYYSEEIYGRINLLLSIALIIHTIVDFGYSTSLVVFKNRPDNSTTDHELVNYLFFKHYFFSIIACTVGILLLRQKYEFTEVELFFLAANGAFIGAYRYLLSILQAFGNWGPYNLLVVCNNLIKFISVVGGVAMMGFVTELPVSVFYCFAFLAIYSFSICMIALLMTRKKLGLKSPIEVKAKTDFRKILLPLGFANIVIALGSRVDYIIIEELQDEHYLGVYAVANTLAFAFILVTNSLMKVFLKMGSEDPQRFLYRLLELQKRYFFPFIVVLVLVISSASQLVPFVFGEKYTPSIRCFQILVIPYLGGVFFTPLESYFYATNSFLIFLVKSGQLIVISTVGFLLVYQIGLVGMAIAILLSRIFTWMFFFKKARMANRNYLPHDEV